MGSRTAAEDLADLELAERLQRRVAEAPQEVLVSGRELLARHRIQPEARAVAHRALARALRGLDRPQESVREARRSAQVARRAGLAEREAEARLTLALSLFQTGRGRDSITQIEQAATLATGPTALIVSAQHGILLARLGRLDEALERYTAALGGPLPPADRARVLNNRGIALAFAGRCDASVADLEAAIGLAREAGAPMLEGEIVHNLGFALTVAGDVPAALARFDEADAAFAELGAPIGLNLVARARALLRANLYREARRAASDAVDELAAGGAAADAAEARVLLASAELEDGDAAQAVQTAATARRALRRQGRPALAALADHVTVRARVRLGQRDRRTVELAARSADALGDVGLAAEELDARLTAGLIARELGQVELAAAQLDAVRARRDRGPLVDRARAWRAEAVCRLDRGDRSGSRSAVEAGLEAVADLQAIMGATELRVSVAGHGTGLADLGLELALADGDAWAVVQLLDRWRNASLTLGATADDPASRTELAARRAAVSRLQEVAASGEDPSSARRAVTEIEQRIQARARHAPGARGQRRDLLDPGSLVAGLGGARLAVYFDHDGRLGAVVVDDGGAELHPDLGLTCGHADDLVAAALFALRRLGHPGRSGASRAAAAASLDDALRRLDAVLVEPFVSDGAPLVVCPTGPLHALAWSGLPSCASRPVAVVSSLTAVRGSSAPARPGRPRRIVLAAGPGLDGALAELGALADLHPDAHVFDAARANVDDVLTALGRADIAHLACHGRFRVDNPMFSSLELADGPLTVFDLEKLARPPEVVVLAACDVGTAAVGAGDELLGITSALHRAGTRHVIASLVPVPDEAAVGFMVDLHRALLDGRSPAEALAIAREGVVVDEPHGAALRAGFSCFGPL